MQPRKFKRALITGIGGSGGSYLAEYILENHPSVEVHGILRWHSTAKDNLRAVSDRLFLHEVDLNDFGATFSALAGVKPEAIFHLASHANVRASFETPVAVLQNNIIGTANLFESLRIAKLSPVVVMASTSEIYGKVKPDEVPIREDAPFRPANPYAVSKVAQDLLGGVYFLSYQLPVIRVRMFTYVNPRRTDLFATAFARQVARIEAGLQKELRHGNLESVRTLLDVRDSMRAYWEAACFGEPGEVYNVGGTFTMTVGGVLGRLVAMATKTIPTRLDPALLRPTDVTLQIPDTKKFSEATGWKPRYDIEESLRFLLEYWRKETRKEALVGSM